MHDLAANSQVPDAVQDTATKYDLGRLQAIYTSTSNGALRMASGVAAVIIGVAISGAYLLSYTSTFAWLPWWQSIIIPLIGIIWIMVGCWILFAPLFQPPLAVYVYSEGLLYVTRKIEVLFWHKIERVWKIAQPIAKRSGRPVKYKYIVRRSDGTHFEFQTSLSNIETLGTLLEQETVRILLPRAIAACTRGETVLFDEIAINEYGIILREGRRKLPWSQLFNLTVTDTELIWYMHTETVPWAIVSLGLIPNVEVLRGLVIYMLRFQERKTAPKIVAYQSGATIDFGVLRINQQGVSPDGSKQFIPWNEIAGIGVSDHEVMIGRKDTGQWYTFPDWMIQDAATLKDLVEYVLQKKKA
jgi:hypothetical protein